VGALLLATIIWLAIHRDIDRTELQITTHRYGQLPINVLDQPGRTRAFEIKPPVVTVTVSGPVGIVEKMNEKDFAVFVNVTGEDIAEETVRRVEVLALQGIKVLQVYPIRVRVRGLPPVTPQTDQ
jgi:YbbR domain-containing protein